MDEPTRLNPVSDPIRYPTPNPDVNALVDRLHTQVRNILREQLVGLYLSGSLAAGDFNPDTSDIDFVVVTAGTLPDDTLAALETMHARLFSSDLRYARKLEGDYIPRSVLRRYKPEQAPYPHYGMDGHFAVEQHGIDSVIQHYVLREWGIPVAGPAPRTLVDPIAPDDLRRAASATLMEWWAPQLDDPVRLQSDLYQTYAVLTMCRIFYTMEHGDVVSKPVAARWLQEALGQPWADLIADALAWRPGMRFARLNDTLDFIRFTVARWGKSEGDAKQTR
jgi:hypothetical protein